MKELFGVYFNRWGLTPDGEPIVTPTSQLLPVRVGGIPAMLKIALVDEESRSGWLMAWWSGLGAAHVLAYEDGAMLMERAANRRSLAQLARHGSDEEASRILCATVANLHEPRLGPPPPSLIPLEQWFCALAPAARLHGGILRHAAAAAEELLSQPHDACALHGDVHHGNVLDFGASGWLAIDPKGLFGACAFDYANLFCNPDSETATIPGRFTRQLDIVAEAADLERNLLARWILAWAGLSAAFQFQDGLSPQTALRMAELAFAQSNR